MGGRERWKLARFIDQHGDLTLGEHPKTAGEHRCIPYGNVKERRSSAKVIHEKESNNGNKKQSTCGWSYFLRWISKMTAYLLKIMDSLALSVRKGTQGENLTLVQQIFKQTENLWRCRVSRPGMKQAHDSYEQD